MMIQCISLWNPWAALIALQAKQIETRSWQPRLKRGQLLAIHAAKKWNRDLADLCLLEPFATALQPIGGASGIQFGGFVALAEFIEAVPTTDAQPSEQERAFGDYSPGRYAWLLDNIRPISFIPARGYQALWTVPTATFGAAPDAEDVVTPAWSDRSSFAPRQQRICFEAEVHPEPEEG